MKNKLSKYEQYILNSDIALLEAKIIFDEKFYGLLKRINSPISTNLKMLAGNEVDINHNYITFDIDKEDKVLFIPDDKAKKSDNPYSLKKSEMNVGRFVRALLTKAGREVNNKELEDFVNKYKASILIEKEAFSRFEVVKGEDIRFWYNVSNYEKEMGSLGGSCMRYEKCSNFFDIYCKNPNKVSLILLKSKSDKDKICGRALLWIDDEGRKFMDRIYIIDSADTQLFKDYAVDNNFYYKKNQSFHVGEPIMFNGDELSREESWVRVTLDTGGYFDKYPYMDSLKYYNPNTCVLSSNWNDDYEFELCDTMGGDGSCSECGGGGRLDCGECGGDGNVSCWRCHGNGEMDCNNCDGYGRHDCGRCDGHGEVECPICDGYAELECPDCDGTGENGEESCENCNGSGKANCYNCESGKVECPECNGDGKEECQDCSGSGLETCSRCDGEGSSECQDCGGGGTVACYECG